MVAAGGIAGGFADDDQNGRPGGAPPEIFDHVITVTVKAFAEYRPPDETSGNRPQPISAKLAAPGYLEFRLHVNGLGADRVVDSETASGPLPTLSGDGAGDALTEREREVLSLLSLGYTDNAVARRLALSRRTVGYAVAGMMRRFGVSTRFQLGLILGRHKPPESA